MEEQTRIGNVNARPAARTGAKTIASACPFCMTMVTDGIKAQGKEDEVRNMDVVEMLAIACGAEDSKRRSTAPEATEEAAAAPAE